MWLLSLGLGCGGTKDVHPPVSAEPNQDTADGEQEDTAPPVDTADTSTGIGAPCLDRAPEDWAGCVVTGEFSEWYDGERTTRLEFEAATPAPCHEVGCVWLFETTCVLHPDGGTVGAGPCELLYYPDGVTGSGLGEVGMAFDGLRTCLLGAVQADGALTLSTRPKGSDEDAEVGGYGQNSCAGGGRYDASGTLTVE